MRVKRVGDYYVVSFMRKVIWYGHKDEATYSECWKFAFNWANKYGVEFAKGLI